jgi:hypothetical protein
MKLCGCKFDDRNRVVDKVRLNAHNYQIRKEKRIEASNEEPVIGATGDGSLIREAG